MFVESFQGQYKDGTDGSRDFRMVSASFLILRILIVASYSPHHWSPWPKFDVQCMSFIITCCLYAIIRPYRLNYRNNVDISVVASLAILSLSFPTALNHYNTASVTLSVMISTLLLGIPHMVLMFSLCHKFAKKTGITQWLKTKICVSANRCVCQAQGDREAEFNTDSLPDRIINPGEYDPLLHTVVEHSVTGPEEDKESGATRLIPVYTYGSTK